MNRPVFYFYVDATDDAVTSAAPLDLGMLLASCKKISVVNTTEEPIIIIADGTPLKHIFGAFGDEQCIHMDLAKGAAISVRSLGANASTGFLAINFFA